MKMSLLGPSIVFAAGLLAACSGADQNGNGANGGNGGDGANTGKGGGNTGGGGANTGTGANTSTGGSNTGTGGSGANTGGSGGNTGGNTGSGGAGGTLGEPCGGIAGIPCDPTTYCDFPDNICGAADGQGTCTEKPGGCTDEYKPVCACDGQVYSNSCEAAAAGQDVSSLKSCEPPLGFFPCGFGFCSSKDEFCQIQISDVVGIPDSYSCEALPPACQFPNATCACLSDLFCGNMCTQENGTFTLTCPGG